MINNSLLYTKQFKNKIVQIGCGSAPGNLVFKYYLQEKSSEKNFRNYIQEKSFRNYLQEKSSEKSRGKIFWKNLEDKS